MLGLHLVWSLWLSTLDESILVQDVREALESLLRALELQSLENNIAEMECLHGKPALSTTTQNGMFGFCGQKPCCEFFCPEEDCHMFGKAVASFHKSGCTHPMCYAHGKLTQMRMVKDKMKESYGIPYFVCSERGNPCSFWQWADVFEDVKPRCRHDLVSRMYKVKKEGPNKGRFFYSCPNERESACEFFEWKPIENSPCVYKIGCLFSIRGSISTRSQILVKHLRVQRPILNRPTKNSYIKNLLTNWLKI